MNQPTPNPQSSGRRVNILGILISPIDMQQAQAAIASWLAQSHRTYVTVTPAHSVMDAYRNPELRRIFNASG